MKTIAAGVCGPLASQIGSFAVVLVGTSYTQAFDSIGSGLPSGWTVRTGAGASLLGTEATLVTAATTWADSTGNFRNVAAADNPGAASTDSLTTQAGYLDRALGVRQVAATDPGAAFVFQIDNTTGFEDFSLSLKAQLLSHQTRSTTWTFDYRLGESGSFTSLGTFSDPGAFGSTTVAFNSAQLSNWNDQGSSVYFRVAALAGSTGSGSRDTFGIDDFSLAYSASAPPVPEPAEYGIVAALGLLGFAVARRYVQRTT